MYKFVHDKKYSIKPVIVQVEAEVVPNMMEVYLRHHMMHKNLPLPTACHSLLTDLQVYCYISYIS